MEWENISKDGFGHSHLDIEILFWCVLFFLLGSHAAQDGLRLTMWPRMTLNFCSSCLYLPRVEMTGAHHHAWFVQRRDGVQDFMHAAQSFYLVNARLIRFYIK